MFIFVQAFMHFMHFKYSGFLSVSTRPWDIYPLLFMSSFLSNTVTVISSDRDKFYSFMYHEECLAATPILDLLSEISSFVLYNPDISIRI